MNAAHLGRRLPVHRNVEAQFRHTSAFCRARDPRQQAGFGDLDTNAQAPLRLLGIRSVGHAADGIRWARKTPRSRGVPSLG